MLDLIRRKKKSAIIKVVFWTIIAAFVGTIFLVWGKGRDGGGQTTGEVVATVNGTDITYQEYQTTHSNLYRLYQNIYREQFTPEMEKQLRLRSQALDSLIEQTLLLQEADRLGFEITRKELVGSIAEIPAFQENGAFSKERYLQVLNYQRMTPDAFEAMQRSQLLTDKVREHLQEGIDVSEEDIEQEYRDRNEEVNLAFVSLAPALFEGKVVVDGKELEAFFAERREDFRLPEKIALRYLRFDPARYEDDVTIDQGDLEKYYRRNLDRFEIPEQVKASHILFRVEEEADEEIRRKKRELAADVLEKIRAGQDFAELARTHSDDAGSAAQGGDLDYFTRNTMVAPFENAAFGLDPGEVSEIVETPFGFHIIKSEDYIEAGVKPLEDVIDEVEAAARVEKARRLAFEKAMDAYNIHHKNSDLQAAAEANDLDLQETGFFSRGEKIEGIGTAEDISAAAFALDEGELARPMRRPEGVYLIKVNERRESRLPELDEVRDAAEEAYRREKAGELARQAAEEILAGLRDGKSLTSLAGKYDAEVEETDLFSRSHGAFIPRLGSAEEVAETAFTLTREDPVADRVFEIDGKYAVVRLKEKVEADLGNLDEAERQEIRESLLTRKQEEAVANRLQELKSEAEVTISPTIQASLDKE